MRRLALAVLLGLAGCGPQGPLGIVPGGPLAGEVVEERIDDWSFTDAFVTVAIETRGEWLDHSVTVLCAAHDGSLYVPARNPRGKRWVANALRDGRVRIGVAGRVYPGVAEQVSDAAEADAVARAQLRKYLGVEPAGVRFLAGPPSEGDDRAELWLFRIRSAGGGG